MSLDPCRDRGVLGDLAPGQPRRGEVGRLAGRWPTGTPRTRRTAGCSPRTSTSWPSVVSRSATGPSASRWTASTAGTTTTRRRSSTRRTRWSSAVEAAGRDHRRQHRQGVRDPGTRRQLVRGRAPGRRRAEVRVAARLVRLRRDGARPWVRVIEVGQGARHAQGAAQGLRPRGARSLPPRGPALDGLAAAGRSRRVPHAGEALVTLPPAPQLLVDGKLTAASDGGDVPDPQPGHRRRDRPGARRDRRRTSTPRSRRRAGPSTRPTGRPTSSCGCAACASCTRRCSTTPTTSRRSPPPRWGCRGSCRSRPASTRRSRGCGGWRTSPRPTTTRPTSASRRRWGSRAGGPVRREPVGVVAAITPWNVPTQINLAKVGPALAAGCTVVLKPAPDTPWLACELGRLAAEHTDLPAGRPQRGHARGPTRSPRCWPPTRGSTWCRSPARPRPAGRSWPPPRPP